MPPTNTQQNLDPSLDPDVVALAKAVRQEESGGNPSQRGKSGEYGYYQYVPDTWNAQSKAAGVNVPLEKATPDQQNQVWYTWAKKMKDAGYNVGQIASMQNAGEGEPNAYQGTFKGGQPAKGTNKFGAQYDVPAYANKVAEQYQKYKTQTGGTLPQAGQGVPSGLPQAAQLPAPNLQGGPNQPLQTELPSNNESLLSKIGHGALSTLNTIESPFAGLGAIPVQAAVAGSNALLGTHFKDPYAEGMPGLFGSKVGVTPLNAEQKLGDAAQVGSYFVPGSGAIAAGAMGALQGAGSAASAGEDLPTVGVQGLLGAGLGAGIAGGTKLLGKGIEMAGNALSGEGENKAIQGIRDAYASALNLNASERGFETRSGKDLAKVLMNNDVVLGRNANGTLDASDAIPKLQAALDPLNAQANKIISAPGLNTKVSNFIPLSQVEDSLLQRVQNSTMDSLEKETLVKNVNNLMAATKREYGDVVSPQVAEQIKQGLQSTAFKKALTTSDALQKNASYIASNEFKNMIEKAVAGTPEGNAYRALNMQRSDLVDAIKRLTKLDGSRLLKGGRLGNIAGGLQGGIAGLASGFGAPGVLAGDYFGQRAAEFLNNPATRVSIARGRAQAAGVLPKLLGAAAEPVGKAISATGRSVGKGARLAGLVGDLTLAKSRAELP